MGISSVFIGLSFAAGLAIGYFVLRQRRFQEARKREKAEKAISQAKSQREELLAQAKEEAAKLLEYSAREVSRLQDQNKKLEGILKSKEQLLQKKENRNQEYELKLSEQQKAIDAGRKTISDSSSNIETSLLRKVGVQKETVRKNLFETYETKWREDGESRLRRLEVWLKEDATKISKDVLEEAIYKYADPSSVDRREGEITVSHDHLKEKIIGSEGKNLAFLERFFEIDIVLNDAPNTISLSAFNLVTREVCKITIEKLLREKKVDEGVIRRIYETAARDMGKILFQEGLRVADKVGLKDIPDDLKKLIGRLAYRTSYGQNIMRHSLEVGYFAKLLAAEIGADEDTALFAGFFHDIGKAVDQEVSGSHDVLSKEILEKYNFPWEIVHAAWVHHDAEPQQTVEAVLVKAADAISAGRPGARSISLEQYIQKIKELEATAFSFEGVKKAFAISAGREVRVITDSETISDDGTQKLADNIAAKIQEKGGYPGKIKITTIRVTKASDTAKQRTPARR